MDSLALSWIYAQSWWILVLPLISFVVGGLWLSRRHPGAAAALSVLLNLTGALYAAILAREFFAQPLAGVAWRWPGP